MTPERAKELSEIRELQRELRGRLDTLERRIGELEKEEASPSVTVPPLPPESKIPNLPQIAPLPEKTVEKITEVAAEKTAIESKKEEISLPSSKAAETPPPLPVFASEASAEAKPPAEKAAPVEAAPKESFELHFGQVWLVRIGIVILLTGLVFLGNLAWHELGAKIGPIGKLGMLYLAGSGLAAVGWLVKRKRAELATYGKVLIGGGVATVYYTTYAAHFVEPLRVISSPLVGGALLLGLAGGIIWLADRMRSQAVAAATTVLGFYTAAINPIAGFSLFSNLVLSVVAITLLMRRRWASVSFLALVGCYAAFGFWRVHATGSILPVEFPSPALFLTALLFPACYWVVFTVAVFLGRSDAFLPGARPVFLTINNGAFFGLSAPVVAGQFGDQLWVFTLGFGAVLLLLAVVAAKRERDEAAFDGAYLTQGLILVLLGLMFKFSGYQMAILLALQSATLMKLSTLRHGRIFQVFSGLSALVAMVYAMDGMDKSLAHAELAAAGVAVVLTGTAWLCKRQRGWLRPTVFKKRAAGFVALATILALQATVEGTEDFATVYVLMGLALIGTLSIHVVRLPEVVYGAQAAAGLGFLLWFGEGDFAALVPTLVVLGIVLTLMHWWQRQSIHTVRGWWRTLWESGHAVAVVVVVGAWVYTRYENAEAYLAPGLAVAAFLTLAYALATKAVPLTVGSQILSLWLVYRIVAGLDDKAPWPIVVGALAGYLAQAGAIRLSGQRIGHPVAASWYATVIHFITLILALGAVQVYVPGEWRFVVLAVAAFGLCGFGLASSNREALVHAAILVTAGVSYFLLANLSGERPFAPNFLGLSLILFAQQIGRKRLPELLPFAGVLQAVMIAVGVLGVWLLMHRLVAEVNSGFLITIAWSLLAFVVLAGGFILREKVYRLLGLGLLAVSVIRVFTVDVWQLERLYQVLSFIILGLVVLALSFLYNRFADVVRKWL